MVCDQHGQPTMNCSKVESFTVCFNSTYGYQSQGLCKGLSPAYEKVSLSKNEEIPAGHINLQFIVTHPGSSRVLSITRSTSKQANHTSGNFLQLKAIARTTLTVLWPLSLDCVTV